MMRPIDPEDWDAVAQAFDIAPAMVREIVYENYEAVSDYEWVDVVICGPMDTRWRQEHNQSVRVAIPEEVLGPKRWKLMRAWVESNLAAPK